MRESHEKNSQHHRLCLQDQKQRIRRVKEGREWLLPLISMLPLRTLLCFFMKNKKKKKKPIDEKGRGRKVKTKKERQTSHQVQRREQR